MDFFFLKWTGRRASYYIKKKGDTKELKEREHEGGAYNYTISRNNDL
jgi:hypothetical protein